MNSMMKWAAVLGVSGNVIGFFIALQLDLPPGPVLVLVAGVITLGTGFISRGTRLQALRTH
jgi:zinc transport system permease protein